MSTINVNRVVDASGGVLAPISSVMRNRIINGGMVLDQRNNGASVTRNATNDVYVLDRWKTRAEATDGVYTVQQVSDAPAGFNYSQKITVTTADASLGAAQLYSVYQSIEGYNTADLSFGTANAQTFTISFWVKSSLTGTFGGSVTNSDANRSYAFTYTVSAANTWEYKTVTIAGDTTGTWVGATNGIGLAMNFALGVGSNRTGTAGVWTASHLVSATGSVNIMGTLSATWQITGVQLEKGTQATSFEYRQYGQELALCQRYCYVYQPNRQIGQAIATTNALVYAPFPVTMRGAPTATYATASTYQLFDASASPLTVTSISLFGASIDGAIHRPFVASGLAAGNATQFGGSSTILSAEL
jgi:hypothetical protein